jgi:hypothetical protein
LAPSLAEHYTAERLPLPCHLPRPPPTPQLSRLVPRAAKPLSIRRITTYSAAWVRSQSRMSSVSNQETWRWVGEWVGGRLGGRRVGGWVGWMCASPAQKPAGLPVWREGRKSSEGLPPRRTAWSARCAAFR